MPINKKSLKLLLLILSGFLAYRFFSSAEITLPVLLFPYLGGIVVLILIVFILAFLFTGALKKSGSEDSEEEETT